MQKFTWSLLVIALVMVMTTASLAQVSMGMGGLVGLNFATVGGKDSNNPVAPENKTGFAIGGFVSLRLANMLTLEPQLLFMQKGATGKGSVNNTTVDYTVSYNYLEIPVLVKLEIPLAGNVAVKPNVFAGPAFALRVGTPNVTSKTSTQTVDQDIQNSSSTDFGLVFGAGARFPGFMRGILVDLRYTLGLSTIDNSAANLEIKHRVFSVLVGVAL